MNLITVTTLLAAGFTAASHAASPLEFYGKANITVQNSQDDSDGNATLAGFQAAKDNWEIKSNASRFGVKGEFALTDTLNAFYQMEWEVDMADANDSSHFKSRNQGVGLQGNFGRALVGRWDSPSKMLQLKVDLFNDLDAEVKYLIGDKTRHNNIILYNTPAFGGGFKFNVATVMREKADDVPTTGTQNQDGLFDSTSWSAEYTQDSLWLAVAMDDSININNGAFADGAKLLRIAANYKLNQWTFGALWQNYDNDGNDTPVTTDDVDDSAMVLSVAYKLNETNTVKLQHVNSDIVGVSAQLVSQNGMQNTVGFDHLLAKNVTVYAFYSKQTQDADNTDRSYLAGGIEVKF